jgi:YVTN family beta-propeller protein
MKHILLIVTVLMLLLIIGCKENTVDPVENRGKTLYVLNGSAETLSKIDAEKNSVVKDIVTTGKIPNRIRIYDDRIYVVSSGENNIKVIDPKHDTEILQTIGLNPGDNPWDIAFANNKKAYVTCFNTNDVAVIDLVAGTVTKRITVGRAPEGLLYKKGKLYVANTGYGGWGNPYFQASVSVIDVKTDKVTATVNTPVNAQDLAFAPNGKLHVLCTGDFGVTSSGKIAVIKTSGTPALEDSIIIGGSPGDIEIAKNGIAYCVAWGNGTNGFLYTYNTEDNAVIHGESNPINIGPNVMQLTYDYDANVMWIPYMTKWGGDGYIQKFDVVANKITWTSDVVGNGSSAVAVYRYYK